MKVPYGVIGLTLWVSVFASTGASAKESFPSPMPSRLNALMRRAGEETLQKALERYKRVIDQPAAVDQQLIKAGLKAGEVQQLRKRYGDFGGVAGVTAEWRDSELQISADGQKIEIGAQELFDSSMKVNGTEFRWDGKRSFAENLDAYDRLFQTHARMSWPGLKLWSALIPSAEAASLFSIQAAGLVLHFAIKDNRRFEATERLMDLVTKEIDVCMSLGTEGYREHVSDKYMESAYVILSMSDRNNAHFTDCESVRSFVQGGPKLGPDSSTATLEEQKKVYDGLCPKLNTLARCIRSKYPKERQSQQQKKNLKDRSEREWSDKDGAAAGSAE